MKHLRKIFENNEDDFRYIKECFLDVLENPNFEVDELVRKLLSNIIELDEFARYVSRERDLQKKMELYLSSIYKIHIELGKSLSIPQPVNSNLYIGMVEVDLEFLRNKNKAMLDLLDDIEVAINRVQERFPNSECQIYANRREEIDIVIIVKNN